jgi:hypothetical protein
LNDAEIAAIRVLARTTVHGKRFLDGSHDYTTSGRNPSQVKNVDVFALTDDITISGTVTSAATQSTSRYTGLLGNINSGNATFTLRGKRGNTSISVVNGEALTAVRDRINLDSHLTGITASVSDYGSTATISVTVTAGTFNTSTITTGANAAVTINGTAVAAARIDGNRVSYISSGVHAVLELAAGFTGAFTSFTVSDDQVARFSVSTRVSERIKLGVPGVFPETLGGVSGLVSALETGGSLAGLGTNTQQAIRVIDEALAQLSTVEARVDAFTDIAITSADSLLAELASKTEDALDTLNTVDEEAEELVRSRHQALSENAIAAIAIMQQQQSSMLAMLRQLAGLD